MKLEGDASGDIECWPENWKPLLVFESMSTQWNVNIGHNGNIITVGLRYEALQFVMDVLGIKKKERAGILESLRIMEQEALKVFNK